MSHWPLKPIGEICEVNPRLQRGHSVAADQIVSFVPMAAVDEVSGTIQARHTRPYAEVKKGYTHFKDGDVLFAKITPCMENGKAAIASELAGGLGFGSTEFHVLRAKDGVLPEWLFYFIRQPAFRSEAKRNFTGTAGQQRVPTTFLASATLPVPPLPEQRRIVDLLSRAEGIVRLRREAEKKAAELIPALFLDMFGDPATNPKGWRTASLGDLCTRITDGTHQPPKFQESGIPFIFVANIVQGRLSLDASKFIAEETYVELTRRCPIERGDVLYSTVGSYGVPVKVDTDEKFSFQRHIAHLKPDRQQLESDFLVGMLATPALQMQADAAARGIAQKTINLGEIRKYQVIAPPIEAQRAFAAKVEAARSIQTQQSAASDKAQAAFDALLAQALQP